jgi:hypothetical protein
VLERLIGQCLDCAGCAKYRPDREAGECVTTAADHKACE